VPLSFAERLERDLADTKLTADARAAVDGWLKADREFNVWFLDTTKRALADEELTALLDGYQESQEVVSNAWEAFEADGDTALLQAGIAESIDRMKLLRERT